MGTSGSPSLARIDGDSLAEGVYQSLRAAILHGTHRPNQRLVETDLAEELGASRTPVREALLRLGSEGLIIRGRHGWTVREFTMAEIRAIYEVRAALEGYAARLTAQRGEERDFEQLGKLIAEQHRLTARSRIPRASVVDLNDRFHDRIIAAAGNDRLEALVKSNRTYYFNYELASLYSEEQTLASLRDHELLYEAIRRRNADKAELLTREHIRTALAVIEQRLS